MCLREEKTLEMKENKEKLSKKLWKYKTCYCKKKEKKV